MKREQRMSLPSSKPKNDRARIIQTEPVKRVDDVLVGLHLVEESLGLERFGIGEEPRVSHHAPNDESVRAGLCGRVMWPTRYSGLSVNRLGCVCLGRRLHR